MQLYLAMLDMILQYLQEEKGLKRLEKMNIFRLLPICILKIGLIIVFKSDFRDMFMYQHSMNAPDEMRQLHEQFYEYIKV